MIDITPDSYNDMTVIEVYSNNRDSRDLSSEVTGWESDHPETVNSTLYRIGFKAGYEGELESKLLADFDKSSSASLPNAKYQYRMGIRNGKKVREQEGKYTFSKVGGKMDKGKLVEKLSLMIDKIDSVCGNKVEFAEDSIRAHEVDVKNLLRSSDKYGRDLGTLLKATYGDQCFVVTRRSNQGDSVLNTIKKTFLSAGKDIIDNNNTNTRVRKSGEHIIEYMYPAGFAIYGKDKDKLKEFLGSSGKSTNFSSKSWYFQKGVGSEDQLLCEDSDKGKFAAIMFNGKVGQLQFGKMPDFKVEKTVKFETYEELKDALKKEGFPIPLAETLNKISGEVQFAMPTMPSELKGEFARYQLKNRADTAEYIMKGKLKKGDILYQPGFISDPPVTMEIVKVNKNFLKDRHGSPVPNFEAVLLQSVDQEEPRTPFSTEEDLRDNRGESMFDWSSQFLMSKAFGKLMEANFEPDNHRMGPGPGSRK